MISWTGSLRCVAVAIFAVGLSACDLSHHIDQPQEQRDEVVIQIPQAENVPDTVASLPAPVQAKLDTIQETLDEKSIRALVRLANKEADFRSNYGTLNHYDHWYILNRAGIDPIKNTKKILEQPYGVKDFGTVKFYIWPELATRSPEDLSRSRLSFKERSTLLDLVGETGVEQIERGEPYPGFKLAIREDGSWAYLLQEY